MPVCLVMPDLAGFEHGALGIFIVVFSMRCLHCFLNFFVNSLVDSA